MLCADRLELLGLAITLEDMTSLMIFGLVIEILAMSSSFQERKTEAADP